MTGVNLSSYFKGLPEEASNHGHGFRSPRPPLSWGVSGWESTTPVRCWRHKHELAVYFSEDHFSIDRAMSDNSIADSISLNHLEVDCLFLQYVFVFVLSVVWYYLSAVEVVYLLTIWLSFFESVNIVIRNVLIFVFTNIICFFINIILYYIGIFFSRLAGWCSLYTWLKSNRLHGLPVYARSSRNTR